MKTIFISGWVAFAAVAIVAAAFVATGRMGATGRTERSGGRSADATAAAPASDGGKVPEPGKPQGNEEESAPEISPLCLFYARLFPGLDEESLSFLEGDMPPDIRSLVERMCLLKIMCDPLDDEGRSYLLDGMPPDMRSRAERCIQNQPFDLGVIVSVAREAADCPNQVVRKMMAETLMFAISRVIYQTGDRYSRVIYQTGDRYQTGDSEHCENSTRESRDAMRLSLFEAASPFLSVSTNSPFDLVGEMMWLMEDMEDIDAGVALCERAVALDERFKLSACRYLARKCNETCPPADIVNVNCLRSLARFAEGLEGEDLEDVKRDYKDITGTDFNGLEEAERWIQWYGETKSLLADLYMSEEKVKLFFETLNYATLETPGRFDGLDDDVIEACATFKMPNVALRYADLKDTLRKRAMERFGDTEQGLEWFKDELAYNTKMLAEADEKAEKEWLEKLEERRMEEEGKEAGK